MHFKPFQWTAACVTAAVLTSASQAAPVTALTYSMINGGGQASGGTYNYWDHSYTGSGSPTTDGSSLSGGLGKLTDGVIATQTWNLVSNGFGTGQYVGWRDGFQTDPQITFTFSSGTVIDSLTIYIDNSQIGAVFAPEAILINGVSQTFSAAVGPGIALTFSGLGLTGDTHTLSFRQTPSRWLFISEITFDGGTVPEPSSLALAGLALLGAAAVRRRRVR